MSFERELKEALRRPEPPRGFAERVMARIASGEEAAPAVRAGRPRALAAAAMFVFVLGASGWGGYRFEQRRRAERAAEDAIAALRITSQKLNLAMDNIERHSTESQKESTR